MLTLASFRRGKDKKKRKSRKRKYLESAAQGAGIGVVAVPTAVGIRETFRAENVGKPLGQSVARNVYAGVARGAVRGTVRGIYRGALAGMIGDSLEKGVSTLSSKGILGKVLLGSAAAGAAGGVIARRMREKDRERKSIPGKLKRFLGGK